jgi:hypothetical protein
MGQGRQGREYKDNEVALNLSPCRRLALRSISFSVRSCALVNAIDLRWTLDFISLL